MVKNTKGGNKAKAVARKNYSKKDNILRFANEEGEIYAKVIKVMGGNIASAIDIEGLPLIVHIRGKFSKRGKRDNFIGAGTWILVGLRSWEKDKTIKNCDILEVYDEADKNRLKTTLTSINWNKFILNDNNTNYDNNTDGIYFADDATQEYEELINSKAIISESTNFMDKEEEINVDDI